MIRLVFFILLCFSSGLVQAADESRLLEQTTCFVTLGGSLISLQEIEKSKNHRFARTKVIQKYRVEIFLMNYGKAVEARLSIQEKGFTKYEAKGYLMPGTFDGVNLSAEGFFVSCIYDSSTSI